MLILPMRYCKEQIGVLMILPLEILEFHDFADKSDRDD